MKPTYASLVIAAVLTVAVLAVPSAEAANRKPVAPSRMVWRLRTELRATQATLARATSELARIRRAAGVGTSQAQMSQLQETLNTARAQLTAAKLKSEALQAGLRTSSPLAVAVQQVRREVAYVKGAGLYPRGQLVSAAAMDYVVGHVSDTEYGYLLTRREAVPPVDPNAALRAQAGICTHSAATFAAIVRQLGFSVRHVNFSYTDRGSNGSADGHDAVEVSYDGSWHYFDPTYGEVWTDASGNVLPINQIRAGLGTLQKDVVSFTNVFEDGVFGNDTWFVTDPSSAVVIGPTLAGK